MCLKNIWVDGGDWGGAAFIDGGDSGGGRWWCRQGSHVCMYGTSVWNYWYLFHTLWFYEFMGFYIGTLGMSLGLNFLLITRLPFISIFYCTHELTVTPGCCSRSLLIHLTRFDFQTKFTLSLWEIFFFLFFFNKKN